MVNEKKELNIGKIIVIFVASFFLGAGAFYGVIKLYPATFIKQITKLEKDVTVNENGIADAVEKIYDAVVVVLTYKGNNLYASGTGFVYQTDAKKAYILTNYHVIESGSEIKVSFTNETVETVKVEGGDKYSDIAVLSLDKDKVIKVASIGDNSKTRVGDTVFAVGAPLNDTYSWSVTRGIVSGKDRLVEVSSTKNTYQTDYIMNVLQTDTAINSGNSGGPLSNSNGEVIGITSMKLVSNGVEGMGFAIPIETALDYAKKIINHEKIERPYLGVSMINVTAALSSPEYNAILSDMKITSGVVVADIDSDSAASKAGLKAGDIITKIGDKNVKSIAYLRYELYKHNVGDLIEITYIRNNKTNKATVKLTAKSS